MTGVTSYESATCSSEIQVSLSSFKWQDVKLSAVTQYRHGGESGFFNVFLFCYLRALILPLCSFQIVAIKYTVVLSSNSEKCERLFFDYLFIIFSFRVCHWQCYWYNPQRMRMGRKQTEKPTYTCNDNLSMAMSSFVSVTHIKCR